MRIGSSDLDVFPLNLGGNVFAWTADTTTSFEILDAYADGGGNFVDTADSYSYWVPGNTGGDSERLIGEWAAKRGNRDDLVIATKVSQHPDFTGLAPDVVRKAADASLERLQSDRIDLFYAHYDSPDLPIAEIAGVFSELVDAGKVRYIGVSNFTAERIDEWFAAAKADGLHAPVAFQPHYNLVERDFETNGLRAVAERHELGVLPYYALAMGFLTGKYRPGTDVESVRSAGAARYLTAGGEQVLAALDEIAAAHDVAVASVALAWLRHQPTVVAPIASASTVGQIDALLASAALDLSAAEIEALTSASDTLVE